MVVRHVVHQRMSTTDVPKWVTLAPTESVVWSGRPSPYLVKYWITVSGLVLLAGVVLLAWLLPPNWSWLGWLTMLAGLVAGVYAYVGYPTVHYLIATA